MLNSQLFLALSTLRYKRLRLRTVGFIVLTIAMVLMAFGCSDKGESKPSNDTKPAVPNKPACPTEYLKNGRCYQPPKGSSVVPVLLPRGY